MNFGGGFQPAESAPVSNQPLPSPSGALPPFQLLEDFLHLYPFQPATALWRWFETDIVLRAALPSGFGLDLGCGDGRLTQLIADRTPGWRLVGVDPDPAEIELAKECPVYERLHCAFGNSIPEPDARFDFVFSNSVLEHIADVRPVLSEARRLVRPGGQFITTVPSADFRACLAGPGWFWRTVFRVTRNEYLDEFDRRIAHHYYWNDDQWRTELTRAGFRSVDLVPYLERSVVHRIECVANATSGLLFKLYGGRHRPIEIQRRLGMRRKQQRCPRFAAALLARALALRMRVDPGVPPLYGCRLIRAYV